MRCTDPIQSLDVLTDANIDESIYLRLVRTDSTRCANEVTSAALCFSYRDHFAFEYGSAYCFVFRPRITGPGNVHVRVILRGGSFIVSAAKHPLPGNEW